MNKTVKANKPEEDIVEEVVPVIVKPETKTELIARIKAGNGYVDDFEAKYPGEEFPRQ